MEDQTNTIEQEVVEQPQTAEQAPEQVTQEAPQEAPFAVYDSFEEMKSAQQAPEPQTQTEPQQGEPQLSQPQHSMESQEAPTQPEPRVDYNQQDVDQAVSQYLSERLGREISDLDSLATQQPNQLDERVAAIAQFVEETGRNPQDWFT